MSIQQPLVAELIEREIINVELMGSEIIDVNLIDSEIIEVTLYSLDGLGSDVSNLSKIKSNEVPSLVSGSTYEVVNTYLANTLQVFVNGLKQISSDVTEDGNNSKFTLAFTLIGTDKLEVNYIAQ